MSLLTPLMNKAKLMAELDLSQAGFDTMRKRHPNMPQPIKIGARLYWERAAIEAWLKDFLPPKPKI